MSQQLLKVFVRWKKLCKMVGGLLNQFLRAGHDVDAEKGADDNIAAVTKTTTLLGCLA